MRNLIKAGRQGWKLTSDKLLFTVELTILSPLIWTTGLERMLWVLPIWLFLLTEPVHFCQYSFPLCLCCWGERHACVLSHFSRVQLFATLWAVALQVPLPIGFSRQEHEWVAMSSSRGIFLTQGSNPHLFSLALGSRFFITRSTWEAQGWEDEMANGLELDRDLPFGRANIQGLTVRCWRAVPRCLLKRAICFPWICNVVVFPHCLETCRVRPRPGDDWGLSWWPDVAKALCILQGFAFFFQQCQVLLNIYTREKGATHTTWFVSKATQIGVWL